MANTENGGANMTAIMKYWPILVVGAGALASGAVAQYQIGEHEKTFREVSVDLGNRVTAGVYNRRVDRIDRDYAELEEAVEENAKAINELIRNDDRTDAKLQLEIERIRTEIERSNAEQAQQLQLILRTLESQQGGN